MSDFTSPTKEAFAALATLDTDGPVQMLNLVKLKSSAEYKDGAQSTALAAFTAYRAGAAPIFQKVGGEIIWAGQPQAMIIGPAGNEDWDIAFIAQYPGKEAFLTMLNDPDYAKIAHHRAAAVLNSRLVCMTPL